VLFVIAASSSLTLTVTLFYQVALDPTPPTPTPDAAQAPGAIGAVGGGEVPATPAGAEAAAAATVNGDGNGNTANGVAATPAVVPADVGAAASTQVPGASPVSALPSPGGDVASSPVAVPATAATAAAAAADVAAAATAVPAVQQPPPAPPPKPLSEHQVKIQTMMAASKESEEVCNFYLECMGGDVDQAMDILRSNQAQTL